MTFPADPDLVARFSDELSEKLDKALAEIRQALADEGIQYTDLDILAMYERSFISLYYDMACQTGDFLARARGQAVADAFFELFARQNELAQD